MLLLQHIFDGRRVVKLIGDNGQGQIEAALHKTSGLINALPETLRLYCSDVWIDFADKRMMSSLHQQQMASTYEYLCLDGEISDAAARLICYVTREHHIFREGDSDMEKIKFLYDNSFLDRRYFSALALKFGTARGDFIPAEGVDEQIDYLLSIGASYVGQEAYLFEGSSPGQDIYNWMFPVGALRLLSEIGENVVFTKAYNRKADQLASSNPGEYEHLGIWKLP
jgi:hypothetical protein